MRTAVWAAQDGLLAALRRQPWPEPLTPVLGMPTKLDRDQVWIAGEIEEWDRTHVVSGLGQADETFALRVYVLLTSIGTYERGRERVGKLAGLVEAAMADHTWDGTVAFARIESQELQQSVTDDGRRTQLLLGFLIRVDAWLPRVT